MVEEAVIKVSIKVSIKAEVSNLYLMRICSEISVALVVEEGSVNRGDNPRLPPGNNVSARPKRFAIVPDVDHSKNVP